MLHRERKSAEIYAETCPHYLSHTKDSPVGPFGKVNPPLRTQEDIDFLWQGIANGDIDTIGTDHCHLLKEQKKDIWSAVPGFPGVASLLPLLLSEGVNKGRLSLKKVAEVASYNTAKSSFPLLGYPYPLVRAHENANLSGLEMGITGDLLTQALMDWVDTQSKEKLLRHITLGRGLMKGGTHHGE